MANDGKAGKKAQKKAQSAAVTPDWVKLVVCTGGIWLCFFAYGIVQEGVWVYRSPDGTKFTQTMLLLIVEHGVSALVALVALLLGQGSGESWLQFLKPQGIVACAQCCAKFSSNEALKSVSYPIQALAKSSKTLPAMVGCAFSNKKITPLQWIAALGITGGTAAFSMAGKKTGGIQATPLGVMLLVLSLACDGTVSMAQEGMRSLKVKPSAYDQMFLTNAGAAIILLPFAVATGQLGSGLTFMLANADLLPKVLIFALCSGLGQVFIFLTITWFGPDTNAKITTIRKMATVLLSIVWYGHPMSNEQWLAVATVFGSVMAELLEKMLRGSGKEKKEKKK